MFNFYLLSKIVFGAATPKTREKVKERAGGRCEGCGANTKKLIVAHMHHTHNQHYDDPKKLKAYCTVCEFKHHVNHVGNAITIVLREDDNNATVNGLWQEILKEYSAKEITKLYRQYITQIKLIYKKFGYRISKLNRYT